jgi:hypothetical protein
VLRTQDLFDSADGSLEVHAEVDPTAKGVVKVYPPRKKRSFFG